MTAVAAPAVADLDLTFRDPKRDAHRALDITAVWVSHTQRTVKVIVKVRDFARMDSGARVATAVGVHFDTRNDRTPDHLIKIDGMHVASGSTRDWNELRPNGIDPWGDWSDCIPNDWNKPLIKTMPLRNKIAFNAPRACLGGRDSIRVAVQSYKPYRSKVTPDWAKGTRRYLPRVLLG